MDDQGNIPDPVTEVAERTLVELCGEEHDADLRYQAAQALMLARPLNPYDETPERSEAEHKALVEALRAEIKAAVKEG